MAYAQQESQRLHFELVAIGAASDGLDVALQGLGRTGRVSEASTNGVKVAGFEAGEHVAILRGRLLIAVVKIGEQARGGWTPYTYGLPRTGDEARRVDDIPAMQKSIAQRFERDTLDRKADSTLNTLMWLRGKK